MKGWHNPNIRTTEDGEAVGPRMHKVVKYSGSRVWPSMNQLAQAVGPNGSSKFGYRNVKRCLRKNLITLRPDHPDATSGSKGAVILTPKGNKYLENQE